MPEKWQTKRSSSILGLLVPAKISALFLENTPFIIFHEDQMLEAVIAFLPSFYHIDLDYPEAWIVFLSILQRIVFQNTSVHPDHEEQVFKLWKDLGKYISG